LWESNSLLITFQWKALPPGFRRIRHFGFLANRYRREKLLL
jgi:hypothetical protein